MNHCHPLMFYQTSTSSYELMGADDGRHNHRSVAVVVFVAVFLLFFFLLYASLMRRIARRKHRRVSTLVGVGFCAFIGISVGGLLPSLEVPAVWEAGFGRDCWHPGNAAIGRRTQCLRRRYRGATAPPIFRRARSRLTYRLLTAVAWMVMIVAPIIALATHLGFGAALRIIGPS
jgi:hypothetical protein